MNTIVVYKSKYGNTKQYAEIIASKLNCQAIDFSKANKKELLKYDNVIFGAGVYIGKMKSIKSAMNLFKNKPITVYACGGSLDDLENENNILNKNLTPEQQSMHKFFYLPGGMDVSKVKGFMKFMFKMMRKMLEKKKDKTKDETEFLNGLINPTYHVDEKHTEDLVSYISNQ